MNNNNASKNGTSVNRFCCIQDRCLGDTPALVNMEETDLPLLFSWIANPLKKGKWEDLILLARGLVQKFCSGYCA